MTSGRRVRAGGMAQVDAAIIGASSAWVRGRSRAGCCARVPPCATMSRGGQGVAEDRTEALVERMLARDRTALARLMTLVENRAPELPASLSRIYGDTGRAHVVGLTGPPAAGRSALTDGFTACLRAAE